MTERDASTEPTPTSGAGDSTTEPLGTEVFDTTAADARTAPTEHLDTATAPFEATASDPGSDDFDDATPPAAAAGLAEPRPRIRFAGIAWGVVLTTAALVLLGVVIAPHRRHAAAEWLGSLQGDTVAIILALVFGAVLVLSALLATVRRLQRQRAEG